MSNGLAAVLKMESRNRPSLIEPYRGAAKRFEGVLRDVFAMGARPVATMNSLHFGSLDDSRMACLLSDVVAGLGSYGNCVGVPTVGGEISFDESYDANILVNVFTLGVAKKKEIIKGKIRGAGNSLLCSLLCGQIPASAGAARAARPRVWLAFGGRGGCSCEGDID